MAASSLQGASGVAPTEQHLQQWPGTDGLAHGLLGRVWRPEVHQDSELTMLREYMHSPQGCMPFIQSCAQLLCMEELHDEAERVGPLPAAGQ